MAAVTFSVKNLKVKSVVICGHSQCQAISLACSGIETAPYNIKNVLGPVRNIFERVMTEQGKLVSDWDLMDNENKKIIEEIVCKQNIQDQMDNLFGLDFIKERVDSNELELAPLYYRMEKGLLEDIG